MKVSQCRGEHSGPDFGTRVFFTPRGAKELVAGVDHETVAGPSPAAKYVVRRVAIDTLKGDGLTLRFDFAVVTPAGEIRAHMTIETAVVHSTEDLLCVFPAHS